MPTDASRSVRGEKDAHEKSRKGETRPEWIGRLWVGNAVKHVEKSDEDGPEKTQQTVKLNLVFCSRGQLFILWAEE